MPSEKKAATPKTEKKEKTEKTEKKEKKQRPPLLKLSDIDKSKKIRILAEKNPRREGSAPFEHFQRYKNGLSVESFLSEKYGGKWLHLQADIARGHVELT